MSCENEPTTGCWPMSSMTGESATEHNSFYSNFEDRHFKIPSSLSLQGVHKRNLTQFSTHDAQYEMVFVF